MLVGLQAGGHLGQRVGVTFMQGLFAEVLILKNHRVILQKVPAEPMRPSRNHCIAAHGEEEPSECNKCKLASKTVLFEFV